MASLKDRTGYGDSSQGSHDVEFLPLVADVVGWIGLFVCAVGFFLLLGGGLAPWGRAWRLCSGIKDNSCGDRWSLTSRGSAAVSLSDRPSL